MGAPRTALVVVVLAFALALATGCPPDWDSLPYPDAGASEGEGEGDGSACAGALDDQGMAHHPGDIGYIVDLIDDQGDEVIATTSDGLFARVDVNGGSTELGLCPGPPGEGQLLRTSSGVLIRTGDNSLCAVVPGGEPAAVQQVLAGGPADLRVGGAILVDAEVSTVLVAYANGGDPALLAFATFEVTSDGSLSSPTEVSTIDVGWPEALLERINDEDRVAVATGSGAIFEATINVDGGVEVTPHGQLPHAGGIPRLAFGPSTAGSTPVVVALASNEPSEKVWTGLWEEGAGAWQPVPRSDRFLLSDEDIPMGVLLTSGGCAVHYGDYGYVGVQANRTAPAEPAVGSFRMKDVRRMARGSSDGSLWAITVVGGVARWGSDAPFCAGPLSAPDQSTVLDRLPSGALIPLASGSVLVPLMDGLARVDVPLAGGGQTIFNGRAVRDVVIGRDPNRALVVFASGSAHLLQTDPLASSGAETSLQVVPAGADDLARLSSIAVAPDAVATPPSNVFWLVAVEDTALTVRRCTWQDDVEPTCDAADTFASGPAGLGGNQERIGAVGVVDDALVVLLTSGVRVAHLDAGHTAIDAWNETPLWPPSTTEEFFTTVWFGSEIHAYGTACVLMAGFGPRLQRLNATVNAEHVEDAEVDDRDPFQTALTTVCEDQLLTAGGLGATFTTRAFTSSTCTLYPPMVLGPTGPTDRVSAAAQAGGRVWIAEGTELWQLPAP